MRLLEQALLATSNQLEKTASYVQGGPKVGPQLFICKQYNN